MPDHAMVRKGQANARVLIIIQAAIAVLPPIVLTPHAAMAVAAILVPLRATMVRKRLALAVSVVQSSALVNPA